MKIAIFGENGQVATELARRAPAGVTLEIFGRNKAEFMVPELIREIARNLRVDAIINAAAYTAVDRAETDSIVAKTVNGTSVGILAEAAAATGTPMVQISTDYVFDGTGSVAWKPDAPINPLSAYGTSKALGENLVRQAGGRHAILRTSWVFSSHGGNFVKTMLRLGASRDRLTVVADQIGGPTPAADIADALFLIARALTDGQSGGTYHFSGQSDTSWAGFAREIFAQSELFPEVVDIPTSEFPTPALRPLNSRLDCTSTEADFGIVRPDWKRGLSEVLKELKAA